MFSIRHFLVIINNSSYIFMKSTPLSHQFFFFMFTGPCFAILCQ